MPHLSSWDVELLVVQHNQTVEAGLSYSIICNSTVQVRSMILVYMVLIYSIHPAVYVYDNRIG